MCPSSVRDRINSMRLLNERVQRCKRMIIWLTIERYRYKRATSFSHAGPSTVFVVLSTIFYPFTLVLMNDVMAARLFGYKCNCISYDNFITMLADGLRYVGDSLGLDCVAYTMIQHLCQSNRSIVSDSGLTLERWGMETVYAVHLPVETNELVLICSSHFWITSQSLIIVVGRDRVSNGNSCLNNRVTGVCLVC